MPIHPRRVVIRGCLLAAVLLLPTAGCAATAAGRATVAGATAATGWATLP